MVIKIHESCCSIFNELCFSLHRLAARSLFIIPLYLLLVKRFFKLFSSFFRSVPSEPCFFPRFASTCGLLSCSSDSIPHSTPLVKWFFKVFSGFFEVFLREGSISPKYPPTLRNPSGIGVPFAYPDTSPLSSTDHVE